MPSREEINAIHTLYTHSDICTIALSPYFIDIQRAIEIVKVLFGGQK